MVMMRNRLACCTREREMSIDFDDQNGITTYDGLESCIKQSQSHDNESPSSRGDKDSLFDDDSSSASSNTGLGSFSSHWTAAKAEDDQGPDKWEFSESPQHSFLRQESAFYKTDCSEVERMKEEFSKLLLGEDMTGGSKGVSTALALSNAISNLSVAVFGEMLKLEPLSEDNKKKWQMEMDWLLSPTKYMVELVPAKQDGANGITFEIMTSQVRRDIHLNLPALQKLDSMLIETLDAMVNPEFWYAEVGSREDGRSKSSAGQSKRWRVPLPQIPQSGLSDTERKKLLDSGKLVNQIFKAAKAINENVLYEMPVPTVITDSLPKSSKVGLGDDLYKILTGEQASSSMDMFNSLKLKSEHAALEAINRLEASILMWKERIAEQAENNPPPRSTWSFMKDPMAEVDRMEHLRNKAEALLLQIKIRYPNLPHTFVNSMKIQHSKDIGHSIVEAYSRILGSLAYSILTRIGEIMQEDILTNPNSPAAAYHFPGMSNYNVNSEGVRQSSVEASEFGTCLF